MLRAAIEAGMLAVLSMRPFLMTEARRWLKRIGLAGLYLGLPAWLLLRVFMQ